MYCYYRCVTVAVYVVVAKGYHHTPLVVVWEVVYLVVYVVVDVDAVLVVSCVLLLVLYELSW